jgi:hypothetical protein
VLSGAGYYDVQSLSGIVKPAELPKIEDFFSSDGELLFYFYGHGCVRKNGNGYLLLPLHATLKRVSQWLK